MNYKTGVLNIETSKIMKSMNKLFLTYQAGHTPLHKFITESPRHLSAQVAVHTATDIASMQISPANTLVKNG